LLEHGEEGLWTNPRAAGLKGRPMMREVTITETPRAAGPGGRLIVAAATMPPPELVSPRRTA
jgi:hypothetical protein